MNMILSLCGAILDSSFVSDIVDSSIDQSNDVTTEDWATVFMPEPIAGGTDNVGTMYNEC